MDNGGSEVTPEGKGCPARAGGQEEATGRSLHLDLQAGPWAAILTPTSPQFLPSGKWGGGGKPTPPAGTLHPQTANEPGSGGRGALAPPHPPAASVTSSKGLVDSCAGPGGWMSRQPPDHAHHPGLGVFPMGPLSDPQASNPSGHQGGVWRGQDSTLAGAQFAWLGSVIG